jgi:hypothetical protein
MNEKSAPRPTVQPFDWIMIGQTPCVVCNIHPSGDIEVVHNPDKPSNDDAFRDGEPSLGSLEADCHYQETWTRGDRKDLEDEHDGRESEDDEPSLGSFEWLRPAPECA